MSDVMAIEMRGTTTMFGETVANGHSKPDVA